MTSAGSLAPVPAAAAPLAPPAPTAVALPPITAQPAPAATPPAPIPAPLQPPQTAALPPSIPVGNSYRLQIASVKTPAGAKDEWERVKRQNSDLLGSLSFIPERVDLGERGVFYRIQAGPVGDAQEAERLCTMLRQRKVGCILVKP